MVAHSALSPETRKQLDEMPNCYAGGGYIEDRDKLNDADSKMNGQGKAKSNEPTYKGYESEGRRAPGKKKTYEEAMHDLIAKPYADGGEVEEPDSFFANSVLSTPADRQQELQQQAVSPQAMTNMSPAPAAGFQPPQEQLQNPQLAQPQEEQQQQVQGLPNAGIGGYASAINQEAKTVGAQGAQETKAIQEHQSAMAKLAQDSDAHMQSIIGERQKVMDDYKAGHIDPKHFWNSKSTGEKIMVGIGLILGGLGASANGGHNVVLDMINKRIDQDIDAQQQEMGKKQNLMTALTQQLGDVKEAAMMAKLIKADQLTDQINLAAAQAKDPIAKARAMQSVQLWNMKYTLPLQQQLAQKQAVKKLPPDVAVNFLPKEQQEHARKALAEYKVADTARLSAIEGLKKQYELTRVGNRMTSNPIEVSQRIDSARLSTFPLGKALFNNLSETDKETLSKALDVGTLTTEKALQEKINTINRMSGTGLQGPAQTLQSYGINVSNLQGNGFTPRK